MDFTVDHDLAQRRVDVIREHMDTEVTQEFELTLETFDGHPKYEIVPTGQVFDGAMFFFSGDRITLERVYFDAASLLSQVGRPELLAAVR
ncbi:hypothetical protein AB0E69_40180 [Kribbella sp. NPDC026611]|uniref:hypothetical protein n=1 Tax=Kribbella sp. NPDC026611 TaxID=3154911 RepID=UPI0033FE565F